MLESHTELVSSHDILRVGTRCCVARSRESLLFLWSKSRNVLGELTSRLGIARHRLRARHAGFEP